MFSKQYVVRSLLNAAIQSRDPHLVAAACAFAVADGDGPATGAHFPSYDVEAFVAQLQEDGPNGINIRKLLQDVLAGGPSATSAQLD